MTGELRPALEDRPAPHHADAGDTERQAAALVRPRAGTLRAGVLTWLLRRPAGLTAGELAELLHAYLYSVAPRCTELRDDGWLEDSGARRPTPRGASAIVWRLSEAGAAELHLAQLLEVPG